MKQLYLVAAAVLLTGCGAIHKEPKKVILQHPETMEFVNCQVDEWVTKKSFEKNNECIEEYQRQGYVIWGQR